MANFGLLNSAAASPIAMAEQVQQVTPLTNMQNAYTLAGEQIGAKEKVQGYEDTQAGQQILQKGLQEKQFDLSTPEGWDKSLQYLQQNNAPASFMSQMSEHANKVKTGFANWQSSLSKMEKDKLEKYEAGMDYSAQGVDALTQQYQKDTEEKGKDYADAQWQQNLPKLSQGIKQTPYATPELLKSLEGLTPEQAVHLPEVFNYKKKVLEAHKLDLSNRELESKAKVEEARAKSIADGKAITGKGPDGTAYMVTPGIGVERWSGTEWQKTEKLPEGFVQMSGGAGTSKVSAKEESRKKTEELLKAPTKGIIDAAVVAAATGKDPVLGANSDWRPAIALITQGLKNSPEGAAAAAEYYANRQSLGKVTATNDAIAVNEKTAENLIKQVEPLLESGTTSPTGVKKLNDWLTEVKRQMGDADVANVDLFQKALQSDVARIQSGIAGAGSTPVKFLENGEVVLPQGMPKEAYPKIIAAIRSDMVARAKGNDSQRQEIEKRVDISRQKLNGIVQEVAKHVNDPAFDPVFEEPAAPAAPAAPAQSTPKAVDADTGIPAVMPGNSADAREELKLARRAAAAETDPAKKAWAIKAAQALEQQISAASAQKKDHSSLWK